MANEKRKLVEKEESKYGGSLPDGHPIIKAMKAIEEVANEYK
ncbi:hypothetical protein [Butyrivibrio sp. YAB3001]|nr:hypothetical protein [Butyrivibrio sp. YAB3001]SFC01087.1 hypothetical protein SAMN02910398_01306 [Butyrivibrio sp. YAB3001]